MAKKLHQQFVHPAQDKLLQLINKVGYQWSNNMELLKNEIGQVSNICPLGFTIHAEQSLRSLELQNG